MDDLLDEMISLGESIKMKKEKELVLVHSPVKELHELRKSKDNVSAQITNLAKEIVAMKVESEHKLKDVNKMKKEVLGEKDKNAQIMQELKEKQNASQKVYPRARYSVNLYRDVSHIRWQSDVDSTDVRGFINGNSSTKPFKFDTSKQSQFFITNSLWDMESETT